MFLIRYILIFIVMPSLAIAMPECDYTPTKIKAQKSVNDFKNANNGFQKIKDGKIVFKRLTDSCYYRYQEYEEVQGKRRYLPNFIIDQYGDVINVESGLIVLGLNCPGVDLNQKYFEKRIDELRSKSSIRDKSIHPYKIDFGKFKCLYEYREIPINEVNNDYYYSKFIFDYKGNLYKAYFKQKENEKLTPALRK